MRRLQHFILMIFAALIFSSCAAETQTLILNSEPVGSMDLKYAEQFSALFYDGGVSVITIGGADKYLLVPDDKQVPENIPADFTVIKQPAENIYLAASSAMDLFDGIGSLGSIRAALHKRK